MKYLVKWFNFHDFGVIFAKFWIVDGFGFKEVVCRGRYMYRVIRLKCNRARERHNFGTGVLLLNSRERAYSLTNIKSAFFRWEKFNIEENLSERDRKRKKKREREKDHRDVILFGA